MAILTIKPKQITGDGRHNSGTVCPRCGKVTYPDGTTEVTYGISRWLRAGFVKKECEACQCLI